MNAASSFRLTGLRWMAAATLLTLGACDVLDDPFGPEDELAPLDLDVRYEWLLEGWREGSVEPVGRPAVLISWSLPLEWRDEVFRVYARRRGDDYVLAATVTSCSRGLCIYTDLNVAPGGTYDYYVATVDEHGGVEVPTEEAIRVEVPSTPTLETPGAPTVAALDGALYLRWASTDAARYRVFLERVDGEEDLILVGETDGTSFLDGRAENGTTYAYRIAAIDSLGHVSNRSPLGSGTPRPDSHAEIGYALGDSTEASGFRFVKSDADDPIRSGTAAAAHWRLERVGDQFRIVALGPTRVSAGTFTTALACGPGLPSDGERCIAVTTAPSDVSRTSVTVQAGNTYVFRVTGDDSRTHYGKVRVLGSTTDARGIPVLIFDWAYQLRPDTPALSRQRG